VFESLKNEMPVRFVAVGANPEDFEGTLVEAWPWSEESEVASVQQFDIGIMPLVDSPWERGKCGYKLIQYMACGVPVVASPVGVNVEIVEEGKNGRLADLTEQWELALRELLTGGSTVRKNLGNAGRELVEKRYSAKAQGPRLYQAIVDASSQKGSGRING
jgi:glycosyltransferase involved in cell wall biosynthesis